MILLPPRSSLFPYTTLFRSAPQMQLAGRARALDRLRVRVGERQDLAGVPVLDDDRDQAVLVEADLHGSEEDRKSTRLNSSHANISYAVFCLKKKQPHDPWLH